MQRDHKAGTATAESYKALGLSCFGPASFLKAPVVGRRPRGRPTSPFSAFRSTRRPASARDALGPQGDPRHVGAVLGPVGTRRPRLLRPAQDRQDRAKCPSSIAATSSIVPLLWEQDFATHNSQPSRRSSAAARCRSSPEGTMRSPSRSCGLSRPRTDHRRAFRRPSRLPGRGDGCALRPWQRVAPRPRVAHRRAGRLPRDPQPADPPRGP